MDVAPRFLSWAKSEGMIKYPEAVIFIIWAECLGFYSVPNNSILSLILAVVGTGKLLHGDILPCNFFRASLKLTLKDFL